MIYWGGGHGGGSDVSLYLFDFSTGLWSRVGPPNPAADYSASIDPVWDDYLVDGNYIVPGLHSYNYPSYVPPKASGTGAKGSWLLPQHISGNGGAIPHAVDLSTGKWTRFARAPGVSGQSPYAGAFEDTRRGRLWWAAMELPTLNMLDWAESHPRAIHRVRVLPEGAVYAFGGYYARHVYVPEADMAIGFWCQYGQTRVRGQVLNLASGNPVHVGGDPWPEKHMRGAGFGADWCSATQTFYFYEGFGSNKVITLKPSGLDFAKCSWQWGEEAFNGAAWAGSPGGGGEVPMSRWRYIPALKCFAWSDGPNFSALCADGQTRDGIMQLWRPLGT